MAENHDPQVQGQPEKSPGLAAFLSIVPGCGAFYNGNLIKGITYILIFASLIIMTDNARGADNVVFALMIAGFYIFQIIDSFNEAKTSRTRKTPLQGEDKIRPAEDIPLFPSVMILVLGIVFQLANLDLITYRQITRFWPLVLIAIGVKIVLEQLAEKKSKEDQDEHQ